MNTQERGELIGTLVELAVGECKSRPFQRDFRGVLLCRDPGSTSSVAHIGSTSRRLNSWSRQRSYSSSGHTSGLWKDSAISRGSCRIESNDAEALIIGDDGLDRGVGRGMGQ